MCIKDASGDESPYFIVTFHHGGKFTLRMWKVFPFFIISFSKPIVPIKLSITYNLIPNQYVLVLTITIIFTINQIWTARNKFKHDNLRPNKRYSVNLIQNQTMLSGNNAINLSSISIMEFALTKAFGVQIGPPRAPNIT